MLYRSLRSIQPCGVVPASSRKVSRVSRYSGYCRPALPFAYGAFTLSSRPFQVRSAGLRSGFMQSEPRGACTPVWAPPRSLAATCGITFVFFSSGYLDVSVRRVPPVTLWIHVTALEVSSSGFPHSDTRGSMDICSSPRLFAAYRVFLRLSAPRHPPCALSCLTNLKFVLQIPAASNLTYKFELTATYSVSSRQQFLSVELLPSSASHL